MQKKKSLRAFEGSKIQSPTWPFLPFCVHRLLQGGFNPKKPKPKMGIAGSFGFFWVFLVFLEKGVESTFLNIPDHLRPTCFLHFFREISPGSDT